MSFSPLPGGAPGSGRPGGGIGSGVRRWLLITALAGITLPTAVPSRVDEMKPERIAESAAAAGTTTTSTLPAPAPSPEPTPGGSNPATTTTTLDTSWLEAVTEPGAPDAPSSDEIVRALPDEGAAASAGAPTPLATVPLSSTSPAVVVPAHREKYRPILIRYAQANGLPADLVMALAWKESSWRPGAVSGAGAAGMMQLMPATVTFVSKNLMGLKTPLDPLNATSNIRMATRFLRHLSDHFNGDFRQALIAYNQGITSLKRRGPYSDASSFADTVLRLRASFPAPRVLK